MSQKFLAKLCIIWLLLILVRQAKAQNNIFFGSVTRIIDDDFPGLVVEMVVADDNGPVSNLSAENFQLFEGDEQAPPSAVRVETIELQNLRLALALDISIRDRSVFQQLKEVSKDFLQSLDDRDKVALISFADTVEVVYTPPTNNIDVLQEAIDGLKADISLTASHQTIAEATTLLSEEEPAGRKGVVVITDSDDNTARPVKVETIVAQAQAAQIPIYVVGFGPKVESDELIDQISETGGKYFALDDISSVPATLQEIEKLLRQGYHVTYRSGLQADDNEHDLSITVVGNQGQETLADGSFTAKKGNVTITLPGLAGQTVAKTIQIIPNITAPGDIAMVEYDLDGEFLTSVTQSPYSHNWDSSTVQPGTHTLTIKAVDNVGNLNQRDFNLKVAVPVSTSITVDRIELERGDELLINPTVTAVDSQALPVKTTLLIDGQPVDSDAASGTLPSTLDTGPYLAGDHVITVRVEDGLGQIAEDSATFKLLVPLSEASWREYIRRQLGVEEPRFARWLFIADKIFVVVMALIGIVAGFITAKTLLTAIRKEHHKRSRQTHILQLVNLGNAHNHYRLQVQEALGVLNFQIALNGTILPLLARMPTPPPISQPVVSRPVPSAAQVSSPTQPAMTPATSSPKRQPSSKSAKSSLQKASQTASQATGCLGVISGILQTLTMLLPRSLSGPLRSLDQRLRVGQSRIRRTTAAPQQMASSGRRLQQQVGHVTPSMPKTSRSSSNEPSMAENEMMEREVIETETNQVEVHPLPPPISPHHTVDEDQESGQGWVETPVLEPGETLNLNLLIDPVDPYRRQTYAFTINSKVVEQKPSKLVSQQDKAQITGVSWFWRYFPKVIVVLLLAILVVGIAYLTLWRLTGVDIVNLFV